VSDLTRFVWRFNLWHSLKLSVLLSVTNALFSWIINVSLSSEEYSLLYICIDLWWSTLLPLILDQHYRFSLGWLVGLRILSSTLAARETSHIPKEVVTWYIIFWIGNSRITWPIIHPSIALYSKSVLSQHQTGILL